MKSFPAGLDTLLATDSFVTADLYDFTLQWDGSHLYYTTADTDVSYGGNTYTSKGPYFDQISSSSRFHQKVGLDPDSWEIKVTPAATDPITGVNYPAKIYNQPWMVQVRVGVLDGATVDIHRAYWAAWPTRPFTGPMTPAYVLPDLFAGRVAEVTCTRSAAVIKINSWVEMFTRQMPRHLYQAGCRWTLFEPGCGLNKASYQGSGTVIAVTDDANFQINFGVVESYYELGVVQFITGNNAPYFRAVLSDSGPPAAVINTRTPFPFTVQVGDTLHIWPGCDKTQNACQNKFGNLINFGGFPYIPAPETGF